MPASVCDSTKSGRFGLALQLKQLTDEKSPQEQKYSHITTFTDPPQASKQHACHNLLGVKRVSDIGVALTALPEKFQKSTNGMLFASPQSVNHPRQLMGSVHLYRSVVHPIRLDVSLVTSSPFFPASIKTRRNRPHVSSSRFIFIALFHQFHTAAASFSSRNGLCCRLLSFPFEYFARVKNKGSS